MSALYSDMGHPSVVGSVLPRMLIVGDVALFRDGLRRAIAQSGRFDIVASVPVADALPMVREGKVDVVVLDTSRRTAFSQAEMLFDVCPGLGVVAFGVSGVDDALAGAEVGVRAFVGEDGTVEAICDAAALAARGISVCPPELTSGLLERFAEISREKECRTPVRLTAREKEIAAMVAGGMSNKQIARELAISPATVKNHVHTILAKLELPRRSGIGQQLHCEPA